jgi:tetratricopeptide (TPR) repeat protein
MLRNALALALLLAALPAIAQTTPEPADGTGWFRLGIARHDAGDYAGALAAYDKAESMHFAQLIPLLIREARAYSKTGQTDKAFAALKRLTDAGFSNPELLDSQNDLLPIRLDPRYAKTVEAVKKNAHPCAAPEFRQFDYWLGEWDVESNGQKIASSSIQIILDDCVVFENYQALRGYAGKSFSLYDASTKKWEQRYVDTTGALHHWEGGLNPAGLMEFLWRHDGQLDRMTYFKEGPDRVRQLLETSTDDGKTWATTYDGMYIRRK